MEFGERVKAVRTGAGLTQEQFALRLGVTRQAVSNWENGRPTSRWSSSCPGRLASPLTSLSWEERT